MFKTKVFKNRFGGKLYFSLDQLNEMSGERVLPNPQNKDYKVNEDGNTWYVTLYEYRAATNNKYEWLYKEMANFKIMTRVVSNIQLSIHFFEKWTDPKRRGEQFNLANFKQELLHSTFIYKGQSNADEQPRTIYLYFNRETRCAYVLDESRSTVITMWRVGDKVRDKVTKKEYLYSDLVELLLKSRQWFRMKNKSMPIEDYNRMKDAISSLELALANQKLKAQSDEIDTLANFFVG